MSVTLNGLVVRFDDDTIVDGVDLSVDTGERFAIMGPSGAGKSTILRTIAGLERPSSGSVLVDGVDVTGTPAHERSVGLMFQDNALFPHMTVGDNVGYGLRMQGTPHEDRAALVDQLLDLVSLRGYSDRDPASLSGGEQQRVALARTLAPQPSVILFDEPLGAIDQALKDELLAHMRDIVDRVGITSIYVTHDRTEAEAYGERMAIMRSGRIERTGTPPEIWHDPRSRWVAEFMGHRTIVDGAPFGHPGRILVIAASAVTIDPAGTLPATVTACVFRDGRHEIVAATDAGDIHLTSAESLERGADVTLSIDQDRLIEIDLTSDVRRQSPNS